MSDAPINYGTYDDGKDASDKRLAAAYKAKVQPIPPRQQDGTGKDASTSTPAPRFIKASDLCAAPPRESWLVKGYLTTDSLGLLFGDPGCGKSFLAIDLACHVATGRPWRGRRVKQGQVLYIAGEGRNGLAKRFRAWFEQTGEDIDHLDISIAPIQLTNLASMESLRDEIKAMPNQPALIIVDTINRNYGPGDENSTADMTLAVAGLDVLRTVTGAAILAFHHSGHADKSRGRGSSVLKASMDYEYALERFDRTVQLRCTKAKDFDHPPPLAWRFEKQALPWADEDGNPMDSAVLIPCDLQAPPPTPLTDRMGANQVKALDLLRTLYQRNRANLEAAHYDPATAKVTKADWYAALKETGFIKQRCHESKVDLIRRGLIREEGDFIFIVDKVTDLVTELVTEE